MPVAWVTCHTLWLSAEFSGSFLCDWRPLRFPR